jgi:hypothetical protein
VGVIADPLLIRDSSALAAATGAPTLRPYESPTIRHSRFLTDRCSPRAVGVHKRRLYWPGWVSTNGGSPTHPRTVRARHAVPLPYAYPQVGVHERPRASPRATGRREDANATTQPGRIRDPPLPGPAPFTIHHSPFTIHHSPFAIRHLSPLAARHSLLAVFHHSPFAIRHLSPLAARRSPSFSARRSLLAVFALRRLSPLAICPFRFFPWRLALACGEAGPAPRCCSCGAGAVRRSGAILVAPSPPRYSWPSVEGKDRR